MRVLTENKELYNYLYKHYSTTHYRFNDYLAIVFPIRN